VGEKVRNLDELIDVIPEFDEIGYLPPGIHLASLDEIASRFGQESEIRRVQMDSVRWLVDMAKDAGVQRLIINGSFVTDVFEPNDVDCALLLSADFPRDPVSAADLIEALPFIDLHLAESKEFAILVEQLYATDRDSVHKGVIEVVL
jgi:hypothetical protein